MPQVHPLHLQPGDRGSLSIALSVDCMVSEVWDEKGTRYVRVVTPARDERVFRVSEISRALVVSRGNEVPGKVGR